MKQAFSLLVTCVLMVTVARAGVGPPPDIPAAARGAARIVVATVRDVRAQFETNRFGDQLIVSTVLLEVVESLKGAGGGVLRVAVEGGTVGDLTLRVSDMPMLKAGDRGVFFLDAAAGDGFVPHDRGRGIMRLSSDDRVDGTPLRLSDVRDQVRSGLGAVGR